MNEQLRLSAEPVRRRRLLLLAAPLLICGFAPHRTACAAQTRTESRDISGFDDVLFAATGELHVTQGSSESLTIEAEPDILRKITSEVSGKRLTLGFSASRVVARERIVFRLQVRDLRALELQTSGSVQLGPLEVRELLLLLSGSGDIDCASVSATTMDVRLDGSGNVSIDSGDVDQLQIAIGGSGAVRAEGLRSQRAEVSIGGSGDVQVRAANRLMVRISGSGDVRYSGNPRVEQSITGAGSVEQGR